MDESHAGPLSVRQAVFAALPFDLAMPDLLPKKAHEAAHSPVFQMALVRLAAWPELQAGLWLYVDDLEASHRISQGLHDATGSFWHAIMHRREGDFSNSKYWYRQAGAHPAMADLEGYDPFRFVDAVASATGSPPELVDLQRREWSALFDWCCANAS